MTTLTPDVRREAASQLTAGAGGSWLVIAGQELRDIWLSARGPAIVIGTSLLLSLLTYLAASNEELNIIDQRDTVNLLAQITMALAVGVSLLFTADCVSGERERETLESLLVTPVPRGQVALGKYLAAVSMWPVLLIVAIPYIWVLREGDGVFADAMLGALRRKEPLLAVLEVTFFIFVLLLAPTQLPLGGWFGDLITQTNPMTAGSTFLHRAIVKEHGWGEDLDLLIAPAVWAIAMTGVAFIAAGRLRLQGSFGR